MISRVFNFDVEHYSPVGQGYFLVVQPKTEGKKLKLSELLSTGGFLGDAQKMSGKISKRVIHCEGAG